MKIDWEKIWKEFDDELDAHLQAGNLNEWSHQQRIIQRVVERNLTTRAADSGYCDCGNTFPAESIGAPCEECEGIIRPRR